MHARAHTPTGERRGQKEDEIGHDPTPGELCLLQLPLVYLPHAANLMICTHASVWLSFVRRQVCMLSGIQARLHASASTCAHAHACPHLGRPGIPRKAGFAPALSPPPPATLPDHGIDPCKHARVCVCVCVCVCVRARGSVCMCACTCMYVKCTCTHVQIHAYTHAHMRAHRERERHTDLMKEETSGVKVQGR